MTIYAELSRIQKGLKAPKNQRNAFGGYNYRSCEDILEAVKPLLDDCSLTVSDEIVAIGDRFYVKATARLSLSAEDYVQNIAFAREPLAKKGMDEAQVTGATSSYARKYALNGLLAIDDTKDADTTNDHGKSNDNNDFTKEAATEKAARTKAINKAKASGDAYQQPQQKPLSERFEKARAWLATQTPESFKNATKSVIDSLNQLVTDLSAAGSISWAEEIKSRFMQLSDIDDNINY